MNLSKKDADLYFEMMWSLQFYVNQKLGILPIIKTLGQYKNLPTPEKLKVRDALYDHIQLIDPYLEDNPQEFPDAGLEIVESWKKFVHGDFFIERILKKYTIFIEGEKVYAVLGLHDSFEDILYRPSLPYYVQAVLLPFRDHIIYDGLLQGYNVMFGSGVKFDLKEIYMTAKQNNRIIQSLNPKRQAEIEARKVKPTKDWRPTLEDISKQVKQLRSSSGAPAIHSPAFSLAKASIEFAKKAVENPEDIDTLWKSLEKIERILRKAETVLYRTG
jgi:hypothetical protein